MLHTIEKVLHLRRMGLFASLLVEDLMGVARIAEEVHFEIGDVISREGDAGDCMYLLVLGEVRVVVGGEVVRRMGEGECFGEMALLDDEPRSATVVAATAVTALRIGSDDFHEIVAERGDILRAFVHVLTRRLREPPKS